MDVRRSTRNKSHVASEGSDSLIAQHYAKLGNYTKAQVYANNVIANYPRSPEGYLLSGKLYMQQGKHQAAATVYERGARAMKQERDRVVFRDEHENAIKRLEEEKEHDFVQALPTELAKLIFEDIVIDLPSTQDGILQYTLVSKRWRRFLVTQCTKLWRTAWWAPFHKSASFVMLELVGHHIRELRVACEMSTAMSRRFKTRLKFAKLYNVKTLSCDQSNVARLVSKVGKQLTTLQLKSNYGDFSWISLESILTKCPRLRHFALHNNNGNVDYTPFSASMVPFDNLRSLLLYGDPFETKILESIIRRSPRLRTFGIMHSDRLLLETLEQLNQWCPLLKRLLITGSIEYNFMQYIEDIDDDSDPRNQTVGLKSISYDGSTPIDVHCLLPFFQKSHASLESLELRLQAGLFKVYPQDDEEITRVQLAWQRLFEHTDTFGNLKSLTYKCHDVSTIDINDAITLLISKAPVLQHIRLKRNDALQDPFATALTHLTQLQHLEIFCGLLSPTFQSLFERHAHAAATLRHVSITATNGFNDAILNALASIPTLDHVTLSECDVSRNGIQAFVKKYCSHSDPKNLHLDSLPCVSRKEIQELLDRRGQLELPERSYEARFFEEFSDDSDDEDTSDALDSDEEITLDSILLMNHLLWRRILFD
ncbi:hypothetical protein BJV82DRAFT_625281 [Fennellomyces sp. T-0311]|nr:hypothetical protein BJV82DRAFT_625281 [Fennellomyces sp. T-0311]